MSSSIIRKFFAGAIAVVVAVGVLAPAGSAQGVTASELQAQIDALLSQIAQLQSQLQTVQGGSTTSSISGIPSGFQFNTNLTVGSTGNDVKYLQILLNSDSATRLASSGVGSPGNESTFFGPLTRSGVIKFQDKHRADVLTPVGLTAGTGFFGPSTRSKANSILGAAIVPPPPAQNNDDNNDSNNDSNVTGDTLQVSLASGQPADGTIARSSNANFTKVTFAAGNSDVKISKMYVTRTGLSANSDWQNVKFVDADGVKVGSVGSFNVNNKATITFIPSLVIEKGTSETYYIRAGATSTATSGAAGRMGLAAASDVVSNASTVSGSFPLYGATKDVVAVTIGTATVDQDVATTDSTPDVGDTDVTVNQFKITAGSTEGITVHTVSVLKTGTASASDTENIELYDVTNGKSLGTVASWDAEGKASWTNLNLKIEKGKTNRFRVQVDIADGPSLTVGADIIDGSDVLVSVTGDVYGFFITPANGGSWTTNTGESGSRQTISSGTFTVTKSGATPATGNIASGDEVKLATFDFVVVGEEMRVTAVALDFDFSNMVYTEVTNVTLVDQNGNIAAGPKDVASDGTISYTDTFIVPVGTTQYSVLATIASTVTTGDTVDVGINTPATMTATGMVSGSTIVPTPSTEVEGNTLTVAGAALTSTTLTTPAASSVAVGQTDFVFATFSLNAGTSGEDINVTAVQIQNTPASASASELQNVEIWANLTSENSSRGDKYETKVSQTKQFTTTTVSTAEDLTMTFTQTVKVPKGLFVEFAVVGDVSTATTSGDTFTVALDTDASDVTASGAKTGTTVTTAPTGSGQLMTVSGAGTLTISADSSQPAAKLMLDGSSKETIAVFRLAANSVEDIDVDNVTLAVSNGTRISTYYAYVGDTAVGTAPAGTTPRFDFADGTVVAPKNDHVKLVIKADLLPITIGTEDSSNDQNNKDVTVIIDQTSDVGATGRSSGSSATVSNLSGVPTGNTHYIFETYPSFSANSSTPSGNLVAAAQSLVARVDVTNNGDQDITFENGDGNQIIFQANVTQNDDDIAADTCLLKSSSGTQYDTTGGSGDTEVDFDTAAGTEEITFDFDTNSLTIPAGQTVQLLVYCDLDDFETDGDTFQLWLDDGTATDLDWGIDTAGSFNLGNIIWKGDIFFGQFVNPS